MQNQINYSSKYLAKEVQETRTQNELSMVGYALTLIMVVVVCF